MKHFTLKIFLSAAMIIIFISLFSQNFSGFKVFIWDNDNGFTLSNPDNGNDISYHYNVMHACSLLGFRRSSGNLDYDVVLPPANVLLNYAAVFVVNGPRSASQEMFTSTQISAMAQYLENGGCLYIEGNNIADFLVNYSGSAYRGFINNYFNNGLEFNGGTVYSGMDTIETDTTSFCHPYMFLYPANTPPDYSVDRLTPYNSSIPEPNYYQILAYDLRQKLYKSTATAYTPPETKTGKAYFFPGKTYMSTTDFSAYKYPVNRGKLVADSLENQYYRAAYLREIMKFFGLARTLVINDDAVSTPILLFEEEISRINSIL